MDSLSALQAYLSKAGGSETTAYMGGMAMLVMVTLVQGANVKHEIKFSRKQDESGSPQHSASAQVS
jgi:hypothetical protein